MKIKFNWTNRDSITGEVHVSESNPEELRRFYTRFEHDLNKRGGIIVKPIEEKADSATFSVCAWYADNEHYLNTYGTREQYMETLERNVNRLTKDIDYSRDTNTTLMDAIVEELKKEGLYHRFEAIEEYYLPESRDVAVLTRYEFDIIAYVNYGSEGTWLSCLLSGKFDGGKERRIRLGTFKTLQEDVDASLIMGELGGAITYIGHKYVNRNIKRFSPDRDGK